MSIIFNNKNQSENSGITQAAGVVGGATFFSRILGAVRDIVFASFFGAGMVSDAFVAAFRIPNLLRRLFGEGSLSIAFVPVYTDCIHHQGQQEADRFAASAFRLLAVILVACVAFGLMAAPWLVRIMAPGFAQSAAKFALTVHLTRTMLPYIFFIGMVALSMGILNVLGHFAAPALAPVFLNLAMIAAITTGSFFVDAKSDLARWLAVGVVAGGVLQLGLQIPFLLKSGIRFWRAFTLWHPAIKQVLLMMGPVLFGAAVFQINSIIVTLLASMLPQGSVSYLYYADRLVQFPLGVFGLATATAVFPTMARQSSMQEYKALRETFAYAVKLVLFITLPSMAGLIVLREPIVTLLFQHGAFDQTSMRLTASALMYYCMGLWAFSVVRVVLNVFYALKDTRTPVGMAIVAVFANLCFGVVLMGPMRHNGLALAVSLSSSINLVLLTAALRKKLGHLGGRSIVASVVKSGVCATLMGVCVWCLALWLLPTNGPGGMKTLPGFLVCVAAGILIYALLSRMLNVPELQILVNMVRKRSDQE